MENQNDLGGRLEEVRFPEVILQISKLQATGILRIRRNNVEKSIFFQDGRVIFARSTDLDERLGEVLLRLGKVTWRQIEDSIQKALPGQRLGTVLVQLGYLSAQDLYQGVIRQVEEILYDLFEWSDGEYEFHEGPLPTQEVITLSISTPDVIAKGMSRTWRSSWIMKGMGQLDTVLKRKEDWQDSIKLSIPRKVKPMLEMLAYPANLEDFLQISPLNNFETCKWLWAFWIIGIVEKVSADHVTPIPSDIKIEAAVATKNKQETPAAAENRVGTSLATDTEIEIPAEVKVKTEAPVAAEVTFFDVDPNDSVSRALDSILIASATASVSAPAESSFSTLNPLSDTDPMLKPTLLAEAEAATEEDPDDTMRNREIQNLNEKQRFIFERLRFEMGAGVDNFLNKILKKVCGKYPLVFEGVSLNEFGELDPNSLNNNIEGNMFENYREAFLYFQDEQQKVISSFLDSKTVAAIQAGVSKIKDEQSAAERKTKP